MPGVTDVVNAAITKVGGTRITSLGDGSTNANRANDIYTELRDKLLSSTNWNFATKRVKLAQSVTTPVFEFDYGYPLPSDWIRTVSVHDNDAGHGTVLYRMEQINGQNSIVTSSDEIWLRYVSRITDPNLMTSSFRDALIFALARDLSIPIASSNTLEQRFAEKAERALNKARSDDGMGAFPELRPRGSWASSRYGRRDRHNFFND